MSRATLLVVIHIYSTRAGRSLGLRPSLAPRSVARNACFIDTKQLFFKGYGVFWLDMQFYLMNILLYL